MPRLKHDRPGMTYACPGCDGTVIYERTGNGNTSNHPDRPYACQNAGCGIAFQYVIERPKRQNCAGNIPSSGADHQRTLAADRSPNKQTRDRLRATNPEDVGLSPIGVRGGAD